MEALSVVPKVHLKTNKRQSIFEPKMTDNCPGTWVQDASVMCFDMEIVSSSFNGYNPNINHKSTHLSNVLVGTSNRQVTKEQENVHSLSQMLSNDIYRPWLEEASSMLS